MLTTLKQLTCNAVLVTLNSPSWGWARASLLIHEQLLNLIPGTIHDVGKIIEAGFRVITQFLVPNLLFFSCAHCEMAAPDRRISRPRGDLRHRIGQRCARLVGCGAGKFLKYNSTVSDTSQHSFT